MSELREITSSQGLLEVLDESSKRKVIVFKHSTACPISANAWREVQAFIKDSPNEILTALIKVIEKRDISNQAASVLGIKHQSPQVLLVDNRKVVWHSSHYSVTKENIVKALAGESQPFTML